MVGQQNKPKSPIGGVKAFNCRSCGGQVELRAPGQTLSAACKHCGAISDLSDDNFRLLSEIKKRVKYAPVIPMGRRGKLEGVTWEVIGFMVRKVVGYEYYWEEYLLFNPYHGFRFLVHNNRHWSLVTPLVEHPQLERGQTQLRYEGRNYKRFVMGHAEVVQVMGEFYWQVRYGDTAATVDYISPPYMLSIEVEDQGTVWAQGVYVERAVVEQAFQLEEKLSEGIGVAANQPNRFWGIALPLGIMAAVATVLALVLQLAFAGRARNEVIFTAPLTRTMANDTFVSPPFVIPDAAGNVEVVAYSPQLANSWLEIDGYLHNLETMENYGVEVALEYYAGVSDGESWSEGSTSGDYFQNQVPGGKYELVLSLAGQGTEPVTVEVKRDVPNYSNILILILLIWLVPVYYFIRSATFEHYRWAEAEE